jgi:hypothetical protein
MFGTTEDRIMDSYGGLIDNALSSFICSSKHNEISKASLPKVARGFYDSPTRGEVLFFFVVVICR